MALGKKSSDCKQQHLNNNIYLFVFTTINKYHVNIKNFFRKIHSGKMYTAFKYIFFMSVNQVSICTFCWPFPLPKEYR